MKVPYRPLEHIHRLLGNEIRRVLEEVLDAGQFVLGHHVQSFETRFASYNEVRHAIGVGNGHDALLLSLKALGIGRGDEVIVPAHTFFATALAVFNAGARPVLVDVEPDGCNIDAARVEAAITAQTRAIIPVHLYGIPADMTPLMSLAKAHDLFVVEDFAQSQGARYRDRPTGSIGHINATSFYPVKNIGALGDGGMITTPSPTLANAVQRLRNYGAEDKSTYREPGLNSRLDEVQAAVLDLKLKHLDAWNRERRAIAGRYSQALTAMEEIRLPSVPEGSQPVFHIYALMTQRRDALRSFLHARGIETLIHYPTPLHRQPVSIKMGMDRGRYPRAEQVADSVLSLPIYPGLQQEQVDYVSDSIRSFFKTKGQTPAREK